MSEDFTLVVKKFDPADPRLGRHVLHDSRSLRFLAPRKDPATLTSVRHMVHIPILDQGDVGSCTGHAGTAALGSDPFWTGAQSFLTDPHDPHEYAVMLYSQATMLDPWPGQWEPDDTGSDGLSIAKALKARGLISGYQAATSLEAALTALAQRVVIVGTSWYSGMYEVAADGRMNVSGATLGGHEFALDELDVENERVWMRNSWGESYGLRGRAWMGWEDLRRLLADFGDCTVLIPRDEPAPQPQPTPAPSPAPTPAPTPAPPSPSVSRELAAALRKFVPTKGCPLYLKQAATNYLKENP